MWKTIAAVMAIISSIIAITIYSSSLPAISERVDDNSTYIKTVDDAVENLQDAFDGIDTRVENLEDKHIYCLTFTVDSPHVIFNIYYHAPIIAKESLYNLINVSLGAIPVSGFYNYQGSYRTCHRLRTNNNNFIIDYYTASTSDGTGYVIAMSDFTYTMTSYKIV